MTGYNSLPGAPPLDRTELYELWRRQSLFADTLVVRFESWFRPTISAMSRVRSRYKILRCKFPRSAVSSTRQSSLNPTILGFLPGYYNSAYGVTATLAPSKSWYLSLGTYDGNGARGVQTGLETLPTFNGYRFMIGEMGAPWLMVLSVSPARSLLELGTRPDSSPCKSSPRDSLRRTGPRAPTCSHRNGC